MIEQTTLYSVKDRRTIAHIWHENSLPVISWLTPPEGIIQLATLDQGSPICIDHSGQVWSGGNLIHFVNSVQFANRRYNQIGW